MNNTYIYIYQTICEANGKSYVGVHKTKNINDGYIGCGIYRKDDAKKHLLLHKAVRKHGYSAFKKHILSFYDTYKEALEEERFIVNESWVKSKGNYNTAMGGRGNTTSWMNEDSKNQWKSNISNGVVNWMNNGGKEILINNAKTIKRNNPKGKDSHRFGKVHPLRKKILQYSLDGELIMVHDSINNVGKYFNTTPGNITSCCKGRYRTCKGFIFRYENYTEDEYKKLLNNLQYKKGVRREVLQFDSFGSIIKEYKSITEASIETACSKFTIEKYLSGKIKSFKGHFFKYKEEVLHDC